MSHLNIQEFTLEYSYKAREGQDVITRLKEAKALS